MNPGKTHLINFSQRKAFIDISITIYSQPLKVISLVKFLGVIIDSYLNMKIHVKHIERACLLIFSYKISRILDKSPN